MPETPLVSIVIPTCNRQEVLARCLDALFRQTYPNYEIIVVDDFSSDDTPQFLAGFAAECQETRFRWVRNEQHAGANPSRNRGVCEAGGGFVAFLDCDCIAEPDWLDNLMRGFTSDRVAAVTGMVLDPPPGNIYDLTFKGTHRMHRAGPAHRLIAGNMCIRHGPLLAYRLDEDRSEPCTTAAGRPDVSVSGRGDEEGLFLLLRAAGYEQRVVPDAVVLHEHHHTRRSFFRQAFRGGRSAARMVYKFHLPQRIDMLPFLLAYLSLPLLLIRPWLAVVPIVFFAGALAAITYNDLFRKGKTPAETVRTFPFLLMYYHMRLAGYISESLRLRVTRHGLRRVRLDQVRREDERQPPSFEDAVCELCGRAPTRHLLKTRDIAWCKPGEFNLMQCGQCGLIITTPRPVPASMQIYYEDWYSYKTIEEVRQEHAGSLSNRFITWMRLEVLENTGPLVPGMKVLDVGAGFGVQLAYYIRRRGIDGVALDMDPTTSEHSYVKDIAEVRTGDLLGAGFESESFDVVTFYESLEHVYQPLATSEEAYRILKPGGRLVVEVPDYGSLLRGVFRRFWFALMVPVHLHHFTKDSLRRVVTAAGFKPVRHVSMFVPFETTASLLLAYCELTGAPMYDVSRLGRLLKRKPSHLPFFVFLVVWTLCFDFPIQLLVRLLGRSGAQTLISVKPSDSNKDSETQQP